MYLVVNDAVTREAITKDQMRKFLKFVHDDVVYCKYYEVIYILFHTGMRISEFCGLTMKDIDLEKKTINIDHQLQRTSKMEYVIEPTKTNAGTRVIPMTKEVTEMFRAIIQDRPEYKVEKVDFFFWIRKECRWLPCIGNTDLTVWLAGITRFIRYRCQISHPMYAVIHIAPTWLNRE